MNRHERAAIIGEYSRQGFASAVAPGGFMVCAGGYSSQGWEGVASYRTLREARRDTGVDFTRIRHHIECARIGA